MSSAMASTRTERGSMHAPALRYEYIACTSQMLTDNAAVLAPSRDQAEGTVAYVWKRCATRCFSLSLIVIVSASSVAYLAFMRPARLDRQPP